MGRRNAKYSYKIKCLSDGQDHAQRMEQGYIDAFLKGYSVIEICRVAGVKSAKYVHAALVKSGHIPGGKRGRQSSKIVIPDGLSSQLQIREISLAQWCAGWRLSLEEVVDAIQTRTGPAAEAIRRDFPSFFKELTGAKDVDFVSGPAFERTDFSVLFDWSGELGLYSASIPDMGICCYGDSYRDAFATAMIRRNWSIALSRLETLPSLL